MIDLKKKQGDSMDLFKEHWKLYFFEGLLFTLVGIAAISVPGLFTLSFELLMGLLLIITGLAVGFRTFKARNIPGFIWSLLSAILFILIGVLLLVYPIKGVIALTSFIAAFFLVDGCFKMLQSVQMNIHRQWIWYMFIGIVEVFLAVLIWNEWPGSSVWVIGTLVGANLLISGLIQMSIALQARNS